MERGKEANWKDRVTLTMDLRGLEGTHWVALGQDNKIISIICNSASVFELQQALWINAI